MPCRPRGPDGDRRAAASRPRSRSRRRSAPTRGGRCRPTGPPTTEANIPALAGQFASVRGRRRPRSPHPPDSGANQGALFRLTGNRRWPHMAPWNTPTVPTLRQPDPRKLLQMQRIPGFRPVGDPGLEPGTSSLSGKPDVPSSPPNSHLIPANQEAGECWRGLKTTGRYKLVAPSWPHGSGSSAECRVTRKRTSCRRYGQARTLRRRPAARLQDGVDRGEPRCVVELLHHVTVGVDGGAGRCERAGARTSAQRLPCRLDGIACLSPTTPAGLRRDRCRRG